MRSRRGRRGSPETRMGTSPEQVDNDKPITRALEALGEFELGKFDPATSTKSSKRAGLRTSWFSSPQEIGARSCVKSGEAVAEFKPYWRRVRRRICEYCGRRNDLSEPRLWVCAGCGVARYCDAGAKQMIFFASREVARLSAPLGRRGLHPDVTVSLIQFFANVE